MQSSVAAGAGPAGGRFYPAHRLHRPSGPPKGARRSGFSVWDALCTIFRLVQLCVRSACILLIAPPSAPVALCAAGHRRVGAPRRSAKAGLESDARRLPQGPDLVLAAAGELSARNIQVMSLPYRCVNAEECLD